MLSFRKKLNQLTEFNQAVVYGMVPETVPNQSNYFSIMAQHEDALDAYLYLQELLPTLVNDRQQLTPAFVYDTILAIHRRIAHSLILGTRDSVQVSAGQYSPMPILLWKRGAHLGDLIVEYFSLDYSLSSIEKKSKLMVAMTKHAAENQISSRALATLMKVLVGMEQNPEQYPYPAEQDKYLHQMSEGKDLLPGMILYFRLAYNLHQLTEEDRQEVLRIVLVSALPENTEDKMRAFSARVCESWKGVDAKDPEAVKALLASIFYEFTHIHPFPNGNGRTPTAFVNLILRSLGYPSILMCYPREKGDPQSLYLRAITEIDNDRSLFVQHLGVRLADAGFKDEIMKETCCLRVESMHHIDQINQQYSSLNINASNFIMDISKAYVATFQGAQAIDVVRFIENVLVFFATGKDNPLNNNAGYQPGLFADSQLAYKQNVLKYAVIKMVQRQFPDHVNQHKPS